MMMRKIVLLLVLCGTQAEAATVTLTDQIKKVHAICIPLLLQYEIMEMQKESQFQPTEAEYKAAVVHAYQTYDAEIKALSSDKKRQLVALFRKLKTIKQVATILAFLYGSDNAEILVAILQQIAQQKVAEISMLRQAIDAIRSNTNFSKYIQDKTKDNFNLVQTATPEEIEQAQTMLQNSNNDYLAMFDTIVVDFFNQGS